MKVIYKTPLLKQVKRLIEQNVDHDPEVSHIELSQSEYTKLCNDLREKHGSNSPRDTDHHMFIDGVCIRRVSA